jgi:branched-chain amino acid aminotransferase
MSTRIWWNGKVMPFAEATVHVTSETAQRGVNAFEGIRAYWRPDQKSFAVVSMADHLDRLDQSLRLLELPARSLVKPLADAMAELISATPDRIDLYLRPTIYLESGSYTNDPRQCAFGAFVSVKPAPSSAKLVSCHISSFLRVPTRAFPAQAKSGASYAIFRLARIEAAAVGCDESILLNEHGHVTETGGASIFTVTDGHVATPMLTDGILDSITRKHALAILRERMGLTVAERSISRHELLAADEVFLTGTLDEIRIVDCLGAGRANLGVTIGTALRDTYLAMCRGHIEPLGEPMFTEIRP